MSCEAESVNRRRHERRPYRCIRRLAPYINDDVPAEEAFVEIQCRDLSAGGISFTTAAQPPALLLVVELAAPREPSCTVVARVVHCQDCGTEGRGFFLIGCQFIRRLR